MPEIDFTGIPKAKEEIDFSGIPQVELPTDLDMDKPKIDRAVINSEILNIPPSTAYSLDDALEKSIKQRSDIRQPEKAQVEKEFGLHTVAELGAYIPFVGASALRGATDVFFAPLEGTRYDTNKAIAEAVEFWREKAGPDVDIPNFGIGLDKKGKLEFQRLPDMSLKDIIGGTAEAGGFITGAGQAAFKAGAAVTEIAVKAARPFFKSIFRGMVTGTLVGKGEKEQTLESMALFGIFEPIAYSLGRVSRVPQIIKESITWRRMTIKERGLVLQSMDEAVTASGQYLDTMKARGAKAETLEVLAEASEGELLRKWNNPAWRKEALARRLEPEPKPIEAEVPITEPKPVEPAKPVVETKVAKPTREEILTPQSRFLLEEAPKLSKEEYYREARRFWAEEDPTLPEYKDIPEARQRILDLLKRAEPKPEVAPVAEAVAEKPSGEPVLIRSKPVNDIIYLEFDAAIGRIPSVDEIKQYVKDKGFEASVIGFEPNIISATRKTKRFRLDVMKEGRASSEAAEQLSKHFGGDFQAQPARIKELLKREKAKKLPAIAPRAEPAITLDQLQAKPELVEFVLKRKEIHEPDIIAEAERIKEPVKGEIPEAVYKKSREVEKPRVETVITKTIKETAKGIGKLADEFVGVLSTRIANISPEVKGNLRKFEYSVRQVERSDVKTVQPMLERAKVEMTPEDHADFDLARKNADAKKIAGLVEKYGLQKEYAATRKALDDIHKRAKKVGFDVKYLKNYHPRIIKDAEGLLTHFQKGKDWAVIDKAIKVKEQELDRYLSVDEKAQVANSVLRGFLQGVQAKPGSFKARKIPVIDATLNKFYMSSDAALVSYLRRVNEAIEVRRFFGKGATSKDYTNIDDSIGAYVLGLIAEGKIRPDQEAALTKLLQARFRAKAPSGVIALYRDLSYIDTMGSPISAITQIGDLAWSLYNAGVERTIKGAWASIKGKPFATKEALGIEHIAQEFENPTSAAKAVQKVFKLVGLEQIDRVGKEALVHATILKFQERAKDPSQFAELRKELKPMFEGETNQLIKDLKSGEITENVKLLGFNTLLDFQPVALSEMPEKYLTGGNGRIFYQLKTFTIKQFDIFRREAFQKIKSGKPKEVKKGIQNLVKLALMFVTMNTAADEIKDFMLGRKTDFSDRVIDNILRLVGFSKFIVWTGRLEGYATATLKQILPPVKFADSVIKDARTLGDKRGFEIMKSVPLGGKLYYWWFGKGKTIKEKRKRQ